MTHAVTSPGLVRLSGHKRFCDGGAWRCGWCTATARNSAGRGPGPEGARTLCSACSSRYRSGHTGPPPKDADGRLFCPDCEKRFDTVSGLGSHRRFCTREIKAGNKAELIEDLVLGGGPVDAPTTPATDLPVKIVGDVLQIWSSMQFLIRCVKSEIERTLGKTKEKAAKEKLEQRLADVGVAASTWAEMEALFRAESPEAVMMPKFHQIHSFLVALLFHDMCNEGDEDEDALMMGRAINHYTWPELLRQYLNLSAAEVNVNSDKPADAAFEFGKMANWLSAKELDAFTIRERIDMLLLLTHRSCETPLIRRYVEQLTADLSKAKMASKAKYTTARKQIHEQTKEEAEQKAKGRAKAKAAAAATAAANLAAQHAFAVAAQEATAIDAAVRASGFASDAARAAVPALVPLLPNTETVSAGSLYAARPGEAGDTAAAPMEIDRDADTARYYAPIPQTDGATDDEPYDASMATAASSTANDPAEAAAAAAAAAAYNDAAMASSPPTEGYYGVQAAAASNEMYYGAQAAALQGRTFMMQQGGGGEAMAMAPTTSMLYSGQVMSQPASSAAFAHPADAAPPKKKRGRKRKTDGTPGESGSTPPKKLGRPPKDRSGDKRVPFDPKKMKTRRKAEAQAREEIAFELQGIIDAMCYRLSPLGFDRNFNSYWIIGARYDRIWIQTISGPRETWSIIKTIDEVDLLVSSLDQRGIRESVLRRGLMERKKRFADEMPMPPTLEELSADSLPGVKQEPGSAPMSPEDTDGANGDGAAPIAHSSSEMLGTEATGDGTAGNIKQEEAADPDEMAADTVAVTIDMTAGDSAAADTAAMDVETPTSAAVSAVPSSSEITADVGPRGGRFAPERQSRSKSKKVADLVPVVAAILPEKDYSAIHKSRACRFIEQEQGPAITRCGYCQEALSPAHERHCPLCHETFGALHKSSSVSGFDKHIRACRKKLAAGDPSRNEEDATLPFWVLAIKGELQDIDAAITPKSIKGWTKPQRSTWGARVKQAANVTQCEDLLIEFITHVDTKYLNHEWRPWREVKIAIAGGDWRKDWDGSGVYNAALGVYVDPFAPLAPEPLAAGTAGAAGAAAGAPPLEAAPYVDPTCHPCNTGSHQAHTCSKGLGRNSAVLRPVQRAPASGRRTSVDIAQIEPAETEPAPVALFGAMEEGAAVAEEPPEMAERVLATPQLESESELEPESAPEANPELEPELEPEPEPEPEPFPEPFPEPEPESDDEPDTPPPATPPAPGMEMNAADREATKAAAKVAAAKANAAKAARAARAAAEHELESFNKPVSAVARKPPGRVPAGKKWDYVLGMWVAKTDHPGDSPSNGASPRSDSVRSDSVRSDTSDTSVSVDSWAEADLAVTPVAVDVPTEPIAATSTPGTPNEPARPAVALAPEATPAAADEGAVALVPMEMTAMEAAPVTNEVAAATNATGGPADADVDAAPGTVAAGTTSIAGVLEQVNYSPTGALYGPAALATDLALQAEPSSSAAPTLVNYSPTGALYGAAVIAAEHAQASAWYEEEEEDEDEDEEWEEEEMVMFPCENEPYTPVPRGSRRTKRWKKKKVRTGVRCIFWLNMFDQAATYGLKAKPPKPPKTLKRKFVIPSNEEFNNSDWRRPPKKSRNRDADGVEKRSHHKKAVVPGTE